MKRILLIALILGTFNNHLLAVPLGLADEASIIDYGADLSIYSIVYDVDSSDVVTQRDLLNLVANATGLEAGSFQRFVCMPNSATWSSNSEFASEGTGADQGWQNTVIDLKPSMYFIPDLNQPLDENVLEALNGGNLQIIYQYIE